MDKLLELAKISFDGENFDTAYSKYSQLVEQDFDNTEAWVGQGLSAAYLATPDGKKFKETEICLEKATQHGLSDLQKEDIAHHIVKSAEAFVAKIHSKTASFLADKEKKPMATGELVMVRNLETQTNKLTAFNEQWPNYNLAILFAKSSLLYSDLLDHKTAILKMIDPIFYVNEIKLREGNLWNYRQEVINLIKAQNPEFVINEPASKDGCFIATAVYGNYNAHEVIELRAFRDNFLRRYQIGRKFIKIYYRYSPYFADRIKDNNLMKDITYLLIIAPTTVIWRFIKHINNR